MAHVEERELYMATVQAFIEGVEANVCMPGAEGREMMSGRACKEIFLACKPFHSFSPVFNRGLRFTSNPWQTPGVHPVRLHLFPTGGVVPGYSQVNPVE